jgi:hypothetical protein
VQRPVEPDVPQPDLSALPAYVRRGHDAALAAVVTAAADGTSGIALLVGGSSTGKTRACWQALELLRGLEPGWRLWHPIDPQGALAGLPGAEPRTVVWLNEAQRYLDPGDSTGEKVAAGLRDLLRDRDRGPVLVLATLWPDRWSELTVRPPAGALDPHAQARELLVGHDIEVPAAFTEEQLRELQRAGDPRLAQAAAGSRDGQVIQYLAGAPELLARYHYAPPAARALIHAAMDARRMGMHPALPQTFLEAAAPGYLTDTEWNHLEKDWPEQALRYVAELAKGASGQLTLIRPRPAPGALASTGERPAWQLADYLDQHGRRTRRAEIPPQAFWDAAASQTDPADMRTLAHAAELRGLYRNAALLAMQATAHRERIAAAGLVFQLHKMHPGDQRPAEWATAHAALEDPGAVAELLSVLDQVGATGQVSALLDRDPAAHASLADPVGVGLLLYELRRAGATGQFTALADRAAAQAPLDEPFALSVALDELRDAEAAGQRAELAGRAVAHASLEDAYDEIALLVVLRLAGAAEQFTALADRAVTHVSLENPRDVANLLVELRLAMDAGLVTVRHTARQVNALLNRDPAAQAPLDHDLGAAAALLSALRMVGATGQVGALLTRDPAAQASLAEPRAVGRLLLELHWARADWQVSALLTRDPAAHASLADSGAVAELLEALNAVRATGQAAALASRAAGHASLDDPGAVARLLGALREAGATAQVTTLLARDPAAHASLDDPGAVTMLLGALRDAGAAGQVFALASRAAAEASLDNPDTVAGLLRELRDAQASAQAAELIERLPAAGLFGLFYAQEGRAGKFRFGREADGTPAKSWGWADIPA